MRAVIFDVDHTIFAAEHTLHDGVAELLAILRRLGFVLGALSGRDHRVLVRLDEAGIGYHFSRILCTSHTEEPKTRAGLRRLLDELGADPAQATMITHAHADILLAKEAGLAKTIGISHGRLNTAPLFEAGADHVVGNIPAALDVLE